MNSFDRLYLKHLKVALHPCVIHKPQGQAEPSDGPKVSDLRPHVDALLQRVSALRARATLNDTWLSQLSDVERHLAAALAAVPVVLF